MRQWRFGYFAGLVVALAGSGCGTSESTKSTQPTTDVGSGTDAAAVDGVAADAATAVTTLGTCNYVNPFSSGAECKAYTGAGWTLASAEAASAFRGRAATAVRRTPAEGCFSAAVVATNASSPPFSPCIVRSA